MNRVEQRVIVKRLAEEGDCSCLRGLLSYLWFVTRGNKYYGQSLLFCRQSSIQVKSAHTRQAYIQNDAAKLVVIAGVQVILSRGETFEP